MKIFCFSVRLFVENVNLSFFWHISRRKSLIMYPVKNTDLVDENVMNLKIVSKRMVNIFRNTYIT